MLEPLNPHNEQYRLGYLQSLNLLDTRPEERFDRITRIASHLFHVPVCLVSLVDSDRQWFKSRVGLQAEQTGRNISFCGHAILQDDALVIEDATKDPRFLDNPLVRGEPDIRFYAGYPLKPDGVHKIGTLCLIDSQPLNFTDLETGLLRDLAVLVEREIHLASIASLDELTGVSNRRGFISKAQHLLNLCNRQALSASMIFIDMDKFKEINDRFGHISGDLALQRFGEALSARFRDSDVIGRIGGDEFAVLLVRSEDYNPEQIMNEFKANLKRMSSSNLPFEIGFSFGTVSYDPGRHGSVEDILNEADEAMYEAKNPRLDNQSWEI